MRRWIPALLIGLAYALSAMAYSVLPEQVSVRWDALIPRVSPSTTETVPRTFAAFFVPTVALGIWLLLRALASSAGERLGHRVLPGWFVSERTGSSAVERMEPTFAVIVAVVVTFVLLFHAVTLGTALSWPSWTLRAFTALVGLGIMVIGNIMPRTRPNWIAGLRTRRALSEPDLWRRTHRYFGACLMVTGIAVIAVSALDAPWALLTGLAGTLLSAITATIFGQRTNGFGRARDAGS